MADLLPIVGTGDDDSSWPAAGPSRRYGPETPGFASPPCDGFASLANRVPIGQARIDLPGRRLDTPGHRYERTLELI